ncbi:hypothetical protein C8R45DRAFT_1001282 [Mycena sanguinolenta]|nr:hypothetical protein C8R45DRAFT_1001282 [Mycena sanguinolenta]
MVHLAQELIDMILRQVAAIEDLFDRLANDQSLRACALTARRFVLPAQRQLFHHVVVKQDKMRRLANKITASPHLAPYIRNIDLQGPIHGPQYFISLAILFERLASVERLMLSDFYFWPSFSAKFWTNFCSLLALPSLRRFAVTSCRHVPRSLICHALRSYEEVALIHVDLDPGNEDFLFPSRRTALHRLVLEYRWEEDAVLRDLILNPDVDLRQVRHVGFVVPYTSSSAAPKQTILRCHSLQHLEIDFGDGTAREPFELPHTPSLRFLTLRQSSPRLALRNDLISLLTSVHERTPNLEVVAIVLRSPQPWRDGYYHHMQQADNALKNLPHLREVHFKIYSSPNQVSKFSEDIRTNLPGANAAGLLVFAERLWPDRRPIEMFSN